MLKCASVAKGFVFGHLLFRLQSLYEPQDGQKVIFHYTAYNENGARIDSSYNGGKPLEQVVGIGGMVPGYGCRHLSRFTTR